MKERILAKDLLSHAGKRCFIKGWLHTIRPFGKINFLIVRDRSGLSQIVIEDKETFSKLEHLQPGSILEVEGDARASEKAELGVEIISPSIHVVTEIKEPPPIEYYKPEIQSDLDFILDNRTISLRNRRIQAVFKIQAEIAHAYRLYMHDIVKATEYFAPNIIGASSEGGAEFFNVDYFGYTATLAQSSQLYKQIMVGVNERVFAIMPFFRAENSNTPRHLAEGKQFEFEMGFFDDWHELLDVQEGCIKFILKYLHEHAETEIKLLGGNIVKAPSHIAFPRLTFKEAQEIFYQRSGIDEREEPDLSPAAEKELCKYALEEFGTDLIFITDWKLAKRPFYAEPNSENKELSNTFDLLCAGTEITSGGERRNSYTSMIEGLKLKDMDPANFEDYLSIFRYGMPPHGGFGMGLERLTMTLLRLNNIREASLFPSDPKRIASNRIKAKIFFGKENIRNEIIRILRSQDIDFKHVTHESTLTSEDSAKMRGTKMSEGVKSIILRGKSTKKNYQINLPSHLKLDMKAIADIVGEKCEFETAEVIKERFGLEVGGIPPFGHLLNLETIFDDKIELEPRAAFNCGLLTESIVMNSKDLIKTVQPKLAAISKEG